MNELQSVRAMLNYSVDNGRPIDYYLYEPDAAVVPNPPGTDSHEMPIYNGWPVAAQLSVDREGFEIHGFDGGFRDFDHDATIKAVFYPQVTRFVIAHTGAKRVLVFDHTLRKRMPAELSAQTTVQRPAVMLVHSDYTVKSGPQRVRDLLPEEADDLLSRRVAFFNVWKPLYAPGEELPLAVCDAQTNDVGDMLRMELKYADRTGEIYAMRYAPKHRWLYFPRMAPDQALLLKTYDSETDGRARFMGHSAFEDPTTPPDAPPRESIEVRVMAFF